MTTDDSNTPELAVEFHYTDGDVGVYSVEPGSPDAGLWGLWGQFPPIAGSSAPSHIILRPNTDEGQGTSLRLYAADKALRACQLLADAYKQGEDNGGSVDWSDVDDAFEAAVEALQMLHATTDELPRAGTQAIPTGDQEDAPEPTESCRHEWTYTGTAYGGDDPSYHGEGRCICRLCGMDGDG